MSETNTHWVAMVEGEVRVPGEYQLRARHGNQTEWAMGNYPFIINSHDLEYCDYRRPETRAEAMARCERAMASAIEAQAKTAFELNDRGEAVAKAREALATAREAAKPDGPGGNAFMDALAEAWQKYRREQANER